MTVKDNFELLARYNQWMNQAVYQAAGDLSQQQLERDRGAFFGSILGTLKHILVGDTIWLQRFARHPGRFSVLKPMVTLPSTAGLSATRYSRLAELTKARTAMDAVIIEFTRQASESDYARPLACRDTRGNDSVKEFGLLVSHFFNHQTHHRGQVTTLLCQQGIDVGVTDMPALIPDLKTG